MIPFLHLLFWVIHIFQFFSALECCLRFIIERFTFHLLFCAGCKAECQLENARKCQIKWPKKNKVILEKGSPLFCIENFNEHRKHGKNINLHLIGRKQKNQKLIHTCWFRTRRGENAIAAKFQVYVTFDEGDRFECLVAFVPKAPPWADGAANLAVRETGRHFLFFITRPTCPCRCWDVFFFDLIFDVTRIP